MNSSTSNLKDFTNDKFCRVLKYSYRIAEVRIVVIPELFVKKLAIDDMTLIEEILTEDGIFLKPIKKHQEGSP
jgi:hypothetical protein